MKHKHAFPTDQFPFLDYSLAKIIMESRSKDNLKWNNIVFTLTYDVKMPFYPHPSSPSLHVWSSLDLQDRLPSFLQSFEFQDQINWSNLFAG